MKTKIPAFFTIAFVFGLSLLLASCDGEERIDNEFYIPVKRSNLYVRVIGNAKAPLLINLHGGPGAFSGFDHEFNRDHLEDDYLIVYLDQRGGGKSDANPDSTLLTMKQFVEDLDVVVENLESRYRGKKINIIGSSWGGTLGLMYMTKYQDKITSFACISGKADGVYPIHAIIEHEKNLVLAKLERSSDTIGNARYKQILAKLEEVEKSSLENFFDDMNLIKNKFPDELGFSAYWANLKAKEQAVKLSQDPAYYESAHYTKTEFDSAMKKFEYVNRVFRNTPSYNHLNIINEIGVIKKPVLVLQGELDYAIGLKQGEMIFDALKSVPEGDKELHLLPGAAHNLNLESPAMYFEFVESFLDKHNE